MPPVISYLVVVVTAALTGVEISAAVATVIGDLIFFGGLYAYNRQQAAKAAARLSALNAQTLTVRQPASTRSIIYGQTRVGGVMAFAGTSGPNNEFLNLVICHAGHQCNAITRFWLNNDELFFDINGNCTGANDQNGIATSKYTGKVICIVHLGSPTQTYDTTLFAQIPAWDSTHRLQGICYTYWQFKYDTSVFTSGLPNVSVMIQGKLIYDPRTLGTVYSNNPALCLRDYLLDTAVGLGASTSEVDDTAVIAAANSCDEAVSLKAGGTEPRYTCNGALDTATAAGGIIQDICGSMAGYCPYIGGMFRMQSGAYSNPVLSISEADLRGPISLIPRESRQTAFNSIKGVFLADSTNWQAGDFTPIQYSSFITEDNGDVIWRDIMLPLTTSNATAQRLANIDLLRARYDKTISFPAKLTVLNTVVGDTITVNLARYGYVNKVFQITSWSFEIYQAGGGPCLGVQLQLREYDPSIYSWNPATQEGVILQTALPTLYNPQNVAAPTGLTLSTSNVKQADGTIQPRLHVNWNVSTDQFVLSGGLVIIQYRKNGSVPWLTWASEPGNVIEDYIADVSTGVAYDVQVAFRNEWLAQSAFAQSLNYTVAPVNAAPATPTGLAAAGNVSGIGLTWARNVEADFDHYRVYRSTVNTFPGGTPAFAGKATAWQDTGTPIGTTEFYWITGVNTSGNESAQSASVNAARASVVSGLNPGDVTTVLIANAAVTGVSVAYTSASVNNTNTAAGSEDTFQTLAGVVTSGEAVSISATMVINIPNNNRYNISVETYADGVLIYDLPIWLNNGSYIATVNFGHTPAAGTHTYLLKLKYITLIDGVGYVQVSRCFLQTISLKR